MSLVVQTSSPEATSLMESVLRSGEPLAAEYPLVFDQDSPGKLVSILHEGAVRSTCATLVRDLETPQGQLRAGLIGSVSTHPSYRRRGLASRVLAKAEEELRSAGCVFSILWADDPDVYRSKGYLPIGLEVDYAMEPSVWCKHETGAEVRPMRAGDVPIMHALYEQHAFRVRRSLEESAALYAVPEMQVLVKEQADGLAAYACMGRGRDMTGVVHEWAGLSEDVLCLLPVFARNLHEAGAERPLYVMSHDRAELNDRLDELGVPSVRGILGLGKLLDAGAALEMILANSGPDADFSAVSEAGGARLRRASASVQLDEPELLQLLCPARGMRGLHRRLENDLGVRLEGLPLTPFLWGLDSI